MTSTGVEGVVSSSGRRAERGGMDLSALEEGVSSDPSTCRGLLPDGMGKEERSPFFIRYPIKQLISILGNLLLPALLGGFPT